MCSSIKPTCSPKTSRLPARFAVRLQVSTSGTDSDFVVKLIDVYSADFPNPDPNPTNVKMGGYQQLVRGDVMRGKFRNSFEKPEPFVARPNHGRRLDDARHLPHVPPRPPHHDPDPELVVPAGGSQSAKVLRHQPATEADFQKATQRVYHSPQAASQLRVGVLTTSAKKAE